MGKSNSEAVPPAIKMRYEDIGNFGFAQLLQKIANTPTTQNKQACHIRRVVKEITKAREQIASDYQTEIAEKFGKRNEAGELIRPEGEPKGFEPLDGKEKDIEAAHDVFGKKEVALHTRPLTPGVLADVKVSAAELELLKDLFTEVEEGPGIPDFDNISQLRRN